MIVRRVRRLAIRAADTPALDVAISIFSRRLPAATRSLAVLTYHRVDTVDRRSDLSPGLISASPDRFEQQMRSVQSLGNPVSLRQVVDCFRGQQPLPERPILITFDDATDDFARFAWPIMQSRNIPATVFVSTDYVQQRDRRFWWDRLHQALHQGTRGTIYTDAGTFQLHSPRAASLAYRKLASAIKQMPHLAAMEMVDDVCNQRDVSPAATNVMNWDQIKGLSRQGVTFAPHTCSHPLLTKIALKEAVREAVDSRNVLQHQLRDVPNAIAYPSGDVNDQVAAAIAQAGFEIGFTVRRGLNDLGRADPMQLRRINVGQATTPRILCAQLIAGWRRVKESADRD